MKKYILTIILINVSFFIVIFSLIYSVLKKIYFSKVKKEFDNKYQIQLEKDTLKSNKKHKQRNIQKVKHFK